METFGAFLRQSRQERRYTLGQLSLRSGLNKTTLSRWEKGTYFPRIPELLQVFDALNVSPAARASGLRLLDTPRAILAGRAEVAAPIRLSLGDLLYGLRQRSGKTQAEAARAAVVSRSLYQQWENDGSQPSASLLHAVGFALGATGDEIVALSSRSLMQAPVEKSRHALLRLYMETMAFDTGTTEASHKLFLLSLLANFGRLLKAGKADIGDIALVISNFGDSVETFLGDEELSAAYYQRARILAKQAIEPIHFHLVYAVQNLMQAKPGAPPAKSRVALALDWQPHFRDNAGKAYLLSFIAGAIAEDDPDEALRLSDRYCALVVDNPDEYPCRLRDRGNLLLKCGRPAESVAFIAALTAQDPLREGLKQLEMAKGLVALGSLSEARTCLVEGKRIVSEMDFAFLRPIIQKIEHAVS